MIPFVLVLTSSISLTLVFAITGEFMFDRLMEMTLAGSHVQLNINDMKVPTFHSIEVESGPGTQGVFFFFPIFGTIFGGIHSAGWFFYFPSSDEAMLWRVSSVVITVIPFLSSLVAYLLFKLYDLTYRHLVPRELYIPLSIMALLVYVVSRLLLLVEGFISLRHLTPGMLALVKWTSFIPHI